MHWLKSSPRSLMSVRESRCFRPAALLGALLLSAAGPFAVSAAANATPVSDERADLAVTLTDSADPAALGDAFTVTATVTNRGPDTATHARATFTSSGTIPTVVSFSSSQGSCDYASGVFCDLGTLAGHASATVTLAFSPPAIGTVGTRAVVATADQSDPDGGNNTADENTVVNNAHGCTLVGTNGNDAITGTKGRDIICDLADDDYIYAAGGNDTLYGGAGVGHDLLEGQNGDDRIIDFNGVTDAIGGKGRDIINVRDGVGDDNVDGGPGADICLVDPGDVVHRC
ncbi:CARDB domain-containing protein [Streptomyces sp. KL118A]|uniref:CARDB domain-containing protein n=1 Tax=Streptomyces sp. KL118A TaxID=3045153 RepID=UPI00278BC178|nr:CARDB domain-containing protein [Streptomyces sp. KL118A]